MNKVIDWLMTDQGYTRENATELAQRNADFIRASLAGGWNERETAERVQRKEHPPTSRRDDFV